MGKVLMGSSRTDRGSVPLTLRGAVCEEGHQQRHIVYVLQVRSHLVDPPWEFGLKKRKKRLSRGVCVRERGISEGTAEMRIMIPRIMQLQDQIQTDVPADRSWLSQATVKSLLLKFYTDMPSCPELALRVCKISTINLCSRISKDFLPVWRI